MGTGAFELREGGSLVVSGKIRVPENIDKETIELWTTSNIDSRFPLYKEDIYKELLMKGYEYNGLFRGIVKSDNEVNQGGILWQDKWIVFIDTVLQFTMIDKNTRELSLPTRLQKIIIDPIAQMKALQSSDSNIIPVRFNKDINVVKCGGLDIRGLNPSIVPRRLNHKQPTLEKYQFIPYFTNKLKNFQLNETQILTIFTHIITQNAASKYLKINEVTFNRPVESLLSTTLKSLFESEPLMSVDSTVVTFNPINTKFLEEHNIKYSKTLGENTDFAVCHDLLSQNDLGTLKTVLSSLAKGGFILLKESKIVSDVLDLTKIGLQTISCHSSENTYVLLRKVAQEPTDHILIKIGLNDFSYVEILKNAMRESEEKGTKIYIYSDEKLSGVIGMINSLRREPGGNNTRLIFIQDTTAKSFSMNDYSEQLRKDLVHNILKEGLWGCYTHLKLDNTGEGNEKMISHAIINTLTRGDLSSLRWIESPLSK